MLLTNKQVFGMGADLGLVISVCNADGFELGRMMPTSADRDRAADIRTTPTREGDCVHVVAFTADGHAFLELTEAA